MQTRFRTLLLAGAASLAMSGAALAQGVTIDGIPATKQGMMKITCTDLNNGAAQPCFVALSSGGQAVSTTNRFPVNADGSTVTANQGAAGAGEWLVRDGTDGPGSNPGTGARGWLSGIAASNAAINTTAGSQADAATASGANTSIIGALRAIRDKLLAFVTVRIDQTTPGATNGVAVNVGGITGGIATFVEFPQIGASSGPFAVKAGPGRVYKITGNNASTGPRRLRVYDALAANVVVGTTVPKFSRILPAGTAFSFDFADLGVTFSTGISFSVVQLAPLSDATAPAATDITDVSWAIQ
ncbi:hypothetical protein [Methylobacterium fujisawaense]